LLNNKGIILAGGTGSRLFPITQALSKQLLPIYDKPMIYYPLATLMASGIRDILIITNKNDKNIFKKLLGDGSKLGINLNYAKQESPNGIAEAFIIGRNFIKNRPVTLILGDNIFHGSNLVKLLNESLFKDSGGSIFAYPVKDPERYGVVEFDTHKKVLGIEEKPRFPKSKYVITGLYVFDNKVIDITKSIKPSKRGELEITDVLNIYLKEKNLSVNFLERGSAWLDTGNIDSLHEASSFIRTLEHRQGLKVGCPEEIAWNNGWIDNEQLLELSKPLIKSGYGEYLRQLTDKSI
tara:strand:+ start:201 stop:1082 length:882 start_codon:yes stop_codon:yes gene_type:complete